jgi:hypothetical protein
MGKEARDSQTIVPHREAYEIKVRGRLDESWSEWFDGTTMIHEEAAGNSPITVMISPVVDQAALRGLLTKIWDLNLILLSVGQVGTNPQQEGVETSE